MAIQIAPDVEILRRDIQEKYTEVAGSPDLESHFHHGRPLAKILEYKDEFLEDLPDEDSSLSPVWAIPSRLGR